MKCRKLYTKDSLKITNHDFCLLLMLIFNIDQLHFGIYANELKSNYQIFVNMQEELGRTAVVADLRKLFIEAVIQTSSDLIINSNFEIQFKFLEPNPLFFLDISNPHEQYLRVNSRVNREAVCSSEQLCCATSVSFSEYNKQTTTIESKPCIIVLLLLVDLVDVRNKQNDFRQSILQVNIHVLDINDNPPEWSSHESLAISAQHVDKSSIIYQKLLEINKLIPKIDLTITEHTDVGTRIALPKAIDPDARPDNTTSVYGIYGQTINGAFSLDWEIASSNTDSSSLDAGSGLWLRINMDLDYENRTTHEVLIYATDAGKPSPLTGYLFVNITVTDINDHPPLFSKRFDEIWIKEHSPVRTHIYRPVVTDKDITDRSRLKFGFLPSISADTKQLFHIDKITGSISVYGQVDFEHTHKHRIPIFVTDGKWTDESELIVNVMNLNDHVPSIQLHSPLKFKQNDRSFYFGNSFSDNLQPSRFHLTILIKENGPPDQLVATVTVTDKDLTAELRARGLNYANSVKEMPNVFSQQSLLTLSSEANRSHMQSQILEPVCKVNHKSFQITPLQVGENYMESGRLRYKINLAGVSLDREQEARFFVHIECHDNDDYDNGYPFNSKSDHTMLHISEYKRHTSTAILEVMVADENDCPPVIRGPLTVTVEEGAPIDTVVLKLNADDADDPTTNAGNLGLRYKLLGEGKPQFTTSKPESTLEGGAIRLRDMNLPPQPWFQLNSIDGELKTLVIFDREVIKSVSVPIEICDGGDIMKSIPNMFTENTTIKINCINATIMIDICDINDCIPSFTQQIYEFNISEDARTPVRIGKIKAYDCDIDESNRNLNYWLQSVHHSMLAEKSKFPTERDYFIKNSSYFSAHSALINWFSISKSGDLYFRMPQINSQISGSNTVDPLMPLDREKLELIIMDLFVKDSGKPSLTGSAQIVLRILDVNDNAPEWEFPRVQQKMINLSSDAAVGHRIAQLIATDPDEGLRGKVTYNLLSGNEGGQFELDSESGWLYLAQPLSTYSSTVESNDDTTTNRNNNGQQSNPKRWHSITTSMFRLYLQATDHGVPPKTSSSVLDIFIQKPFITSPLVNVPQKSRLKIYDQKSNKLNSNNGMNNYETEEALKLSSHSINNDVSNLWSSQSNQSHRGLLLSSDLLILIAMVIATLAALVLIFILFVIVRCRSVKNQQTIGSIESPYSLNDSQHNRIQSSQQSEFTNRNKKWHLNFGTSSNDVTRNKIKKMLPESHFSLTKCIRSPQHECSLPCHKSQTLRSGCLSGTRYTSEQGNQDDDCRLTPLLFTSTSAKSDHQSDDVTVYSTRIPVSLSLVSSGPSSLDENYKSNDYSILLHTGHFIEPILAQPQYTHRYLNNVQSFKQHYRGDENENWHQSSLNCALLSTRQPLYADNNNNNNPENADNNVLTPSTFIRSNTPHINVCSLNDDDDHNLNNKQIKNHSNDQTKSIYLTSNGQMNSSINHTYTPLKCNQHSIDTPEKELNIDNNNSSFV
ncbi:Cadherin-related tumor suppressor isoform 2 [Schistosoma japonicum]|uniref:Cadherin-related tumor suppressor isoform 2 n=1 Tax=Schistosoma japonicum TaxID=6182 RepID=A0A4Z2DWR6_SCHJA|nr:Cadherin-related tumor suppressor isoform 2 [Schistosoma japonicum]